MYANLLGHTLTGSVRALAEGEVSLQLQLSTAEVTSSGGDMGGG